MGASGAFFNKVQELEQADGRKLEIKWRFSRPNSRKVRGAGVAEWSLEVYRVYISAGRCSSYKFMCVGWRLLAPACDPVSG